MIFVCGPDPANPARIGGVAVHVRLLQKALSAFKVQLISVDRTDLERRRIPRFLASTVGLMSGVLALSTRPDRNDLIHLNLSLSSRGVFRDFPFALVGILRRVPLFVQVHGGRFSNLDPFSSRLARFMFSKAERVAVFPGPQFDELTGLVGSDLTPIYNMVEPSSKAVNQTAPPHILYLGRMSQAKGPQRVLDAFEKLCADGISARLTLAGEGPLRRHLQDRAARSDFADSISVPGHLSGDAKTRIQSDANIFVLASSYPEGFPLAFLECAERGMACIATRNSAIRDLFSSGRHFLAVDVEEEDSLYEAMRELTSRPDLRLRLGSSIRKRVQENFTVERVREMYVSTYVKLSPHCLSDDTEKARRS